MNDLNDQKTRKKVGLALSGGFSRATAAIGVIEVLEENNIQVDIVSGCSAGAAVAATYAAGTLKDFKKRLIEGKRREFWQVIVEPTLPRSGLLKGERNRSFFEEFVGDKEFCDLEKKLITTVTDLVSMKEVIITEGKISRAIQASTAVPGIFVPVKWDGKILVDGGNFNMIPSRPLYQNGADYVIAIYVSRPPNPFTKFFSNLIKLKKSREDACSDQKNCRGDLNIFQLVWRTFNLSSAQIKNFYPHSYPYDVLIRPKLTEVRRYHINSVAYCIRQGRQAALPMIPQIKKDLDL